MARRNPVGELPVGLEGEFSILVSEDATADRYGNQGVRVLATPHLVWMVEMAGNAAVRPHLADDLASVGTRVDIHHLAPTPVGMRATARVRLVENHGKRLVFDVEAWDETGKIARGTHERHIVPLTSFLERTTRKKLDRLRSSG